MRGGLAEHGCPMFPLVSPEIFFLAPSAIPRKMRLP
jgi:hypothetical protein